MVVHIHFEKLSKGMKTKLDTRFRTDNNYYYFHNLGKYHEDGLGNGLQGDKLEKSRLGLTNINR